LIGGINPCDYTNFTRKRQGNGIKYPIFEMTIKYSQTPRNDRGVTNLS